MNKPLSVLVLSALVLTSCSGYSQSNWNPTNWFGQSRSEPVDASAEVNPLIPQRRASIFRTQKDNSYRGWELGEVTEVLVERRPGGAILRVTGVADQQNAFAVKLIRVEEESDDSTVTFALKAVQAQGKVGTEASRSVTAALWMTDHQLEGVREIRVKAKRNVRAVRR